MKVAVAGKGGVGKTTVSAFLARCWRDLGYEVVAVDADPDANLAGTLGYRGPDITPLVKLKRLIEERVGGGEGWGGFLKMNPRVDDIPGDVGVLVDGIRVLVMGTIERGRSGCACWLFHRTRSFRQSMAGACSCTRPCVNWLACANCT